MYKRQDSTTKKIFNEKQNLSKTIIFDKDNKEIKHENITWSNDNKILLKEYYSSSYMIPIVIYRYTYKTNLQVVDYQKYDFDKSTYVSISLDTSKTDSDGTLIEERSIPFSPTEPFSKVTYYYKNIEIK